MEHVFQGYPQALRQVGHQGKISQVRLVDPLEDLPGPITFDPEALDEILKLFQCQVKKIGHSAEPAGRNDWTHHNVAEMIGAFNAPA
jgi:hypothetical protein